jgi:D-alanyl-lipoteichoic acid acyltransferase DltB (MBOAT superfamily)
MRILFGFFKKLVVTERLLPAVRSMGASPSDFGGAYVLLLMLMYAVSLYCDFTGGIDITIGTARALGIFVTENFNRPFYSANTTEYWRRWHITMGTWFRDYIFYPMSVSKPMLRLIKPCRKIFGDHIGKRVPVWIVTMVTWFATGFWHGAAWNFIVWGVLNGVIILVSQEMIPLYERFHKFAPFSNTKAYNAFQIVRTFMLMAFIRTFDVYANVPVTFKMYGSLFSRFSLGKVVAAGLAPLGLTTADCVLVFCCLAVLIGVGVLHNRKPDGFKSPIFRLSACLSLALAIVVFGRYGLGYDLSGFIYTKF